MIPAWFDITERSPQVLAEKSLIPGTWLAVAMVLVAGCGGTKEVALSPPDSDAGPDTSPTVDIDTEDTSDAEASNQDVVGYDGSQATDHHGLDLTGLKTLSLSQSGASRGTLSSVCSNPTTYAVDLGSNVLSWSYCDSVDGSPEGYFVNQGSRTLSGPEMRAVNMVLTNQLSTDTTNPRGGGSDAILILTLTYADRTATYRDDFYSGWPNVAASDGPFINGLLNLILLFTDYDRYEAVSTDFDTLSFYIGTMPSQDPSRTVNCESQVDSKYDIDASTQQLSWSLCRSPTPGDAFATVTGSRALTVAEYANIRSELAALVLGASGDCTTVRANKWLHLTQGHTTRYLNSDVGACSRYGTPPYVVGLDALAQTMAALGP
jgi:hypothetical protein